MALAAMTNSVQGILAHDETDPVRMAAEICSLVKSDRYAIFRVTRLNGIWVDVVESVLSPKICAEISRMLADDKSLFARKLSSDVVPFLWRFVDEPVVSHRHIHDDDIEWADFARSGCQVFFRRSTATETLILLVQSPKGTELPSPEALIARQGWTQIVFDEIVTRSRSRSYPTARVTTRERECLRWCAEGKTSEEIGIILSLSTHTVNHYLISATKKLGAVNRMHAITMAVRQGIMDIHNPL